MSLLSQINLERLDTNTIVKYFIDPEDDSNSGFYLYAWSSISKQFIKTTQRADDPDYVKASLIYILDHHLPQGGENPASHNTVLLTSQTGNDHFVIEASLASSVVIEDSGGTGNLVQFASGFEAQTIILTPGPAVDLLIDFIDGSGNSQTLIIKDAARFQFQFGEGGARLSLDEFYDTAQTNGFIVQPLPDLDLPPIAKTEGQEEGANAGSITLTIARPISLDTDDLPETLTLSTRHIKARFGNDLDAETITYSVTVASGLFLFVEGTRANHFTHQQLLDGVVELTITDTFTSGQGLMITASDGVISSTEHSLPFICAMISIFPTKTTPIPSIAVIRTPPKILIAGMAMTPSPPRKPIPRSRADAAMTKSF